MISKWRETGITFPALEFLGSSLVAQKIRWGLFKLRWHTWDEERRNEILCLTEGLMCGHMFDNSEQRCAFFDRGESIADRMTWGDVWEYLDSEYSVSNNNEENI